MPSDDLLQFIAAADVMYDKLLNLPVRSSSAQIEVEKAMTRYERCRAELVDLGTESGVNFFKGQVGQ
jgi:hypothetical protein